MTPPRSTFSTLSKRPVAVSAAPRAVAMTVRKGKEAMIGRRKKDLPKWRYDFNCRKCDNVQFINDPEHGRLGDYCVACVEAFDQGRPDPIHADDDRVVRCDCFRPIPEEQKEGDGT